MQNPTLLFSTYSVVARDPETGQFGVAVQTHQMSVGRVVPWLLPGIGAVATQSVVNISFGPMALTMLKEGLSAENVVAGLAGSDPQAHRRQVAVVDRHGQAAAFTGDGCIREAGHYVGEGYSVQANMMTRPTVIDAMRAAYERATGDLAARMMAALEAAQAEDGDIRGMQSAALKIVPGQPDIPEWDSVYDLRVDEHENPVVELGRLVRLRRAQLLNSAGHEQLQQGNTDRALRLWKQARDAAPELEELAFWQATSLADLKPTSESVSIAARLLSQAFESHNRRKEWIDLIRRLQECGLMERPGSGDELVKAFEEE
jgi:uncharacterized Ntn-hydrolase superfamily protein